MKYLFLSIVLVLASGVRGQLNPPFPGTPTTLIIIGASQSNGGGQEFRLPPTYLRTSPPNVWLCEWAEGLTEMPWGPVQPRTDLDGRRGWGTELQLAADLSARGGYFHILKFWKNSSTMYANWNPDTGTLYHPFVDYVAARRGELEAAGWVVGSVYLIVLQGESDSVNMTRASVYESNLRAFVAAVQIDIGPDLIILEKGYPISPNFEFMPMLRDIMDQIAAEVFGVVTLSAEGVPVRPLPDGRHWPKWSLVEMGHRIAALIP